MVEKELMELLNKRDKELQEAMDHIADLENQIDEFENSEMTFVFSETERHMLEIIEKGVKDLNKLGRLDKDDIKKLDSYVKDFVLLRGKMPKSKNKEIEESEQNTAELVALARG